MNKLLITSLLLLITAGASAQESHMRVLEDGLEVNASSMRLPGQVGGTLDIKTCAACPNVSLQVTAESRLLLSNSVVTLGELRAFLNANPSAPVLVVTPIGKNVVSRIVAYGRVPR